MTYIPDTALYRDFIFIRVSNGALMHRHTVTRWCTLRALLLCVQSNTQ
jgi:hypothetical protein